MSTRPSLGCKSSSRLRFHRDTNTSVIEFSTDHAFVGEDMQDAVPIRALHLINEHERKTDNDARRVQYFDKTLSAGPPGHLDFSNSMECYSGP